MHPSINKLGSDLDVKPDDAPGSRIAPLYQSRLHRAQACRPIKRGRRGSRLDPSGKSPDRELRWLIGLFQPHVVANWSLRRAVILARAPMGPTSGKNIRDACHDGAVYATNVIRAVELPHDYHGLMLSTPRSIVRACNAANA